jgi:hypothetical protein
VKKIGLHSGLQMEIHLHLAGKATRHGFDLCICFRSCLDVVLGAGNILIAIQKIQLPMKNDLSGLKQVAVACACSLLFFGCDSSGGAGSSASSSSPNGRYTYTESGGVESIVTVSGTGWSSTLKLCDYCDKDYESGIVKDGKLYDSSGYVEIGSVSGSSLTMRTANGNMTHRK